MWECGKGEGKIRYFFLFSNNPASSRKPESYFECFCSEIFLLYSNKVACPADPPLNLERADSTYVLIFNIASDRKPYEVEPAWL